MSFMYFGSSDQCQCKDDTLLRFSERGSNSLLLFPGGGGQLTF